MGRGRGSGIPFSILSRLPPTVFSIFEKIREEEDWRWFSVFVSFLLYGLLLYSDYFPSFDLVLLFDREEMQVFIVETKRLKNCNVTEGMIVERIIK